MAWCNRFATYFVIKLIEFGWPWTLVFLYRSLTHQTLCLILFYEKFSFVSSEKLGRIVGEVRPSTNSMLNPCPSKLVKEARAGLQCWLSPIINTSLRERKMPCPLE